MAGGAAAVGALITGAGAAGGVAFFWVPISASRRSRSATEPTLSADGGGAAKEGASSSCSDVGFDIIMVTELNFKSRLTQYSKKKLFGCRLIFVWVTLVVVSFCALDVLSSCSDATILSGSHFVNVSIDFLCASVVFPVLTSLACTNRTRRSYASFWFFFLARD